MAEEKYVWVVDTFVSTDVPHFDRYKLLEVLPTSVRVAKRGHASIIRRATGRMFLYSEDAVKKFYETHVKQRMDYHKSRVKTCQNALEVGAPVSNIPDLRTHDTIKLK